MYIWLTFYNGLAKKKIDIVGGVIDSNQQNEIIILIQKNTICKSYDSKN